MKNAASLALCEKYFLLRICSEVIFQLRDSFPQFSKTVFSFSNTFSSSVSGFSCSSTFYKTEQNKTKQNTQKNPNHPKTKPTKENN